MYNNIQLYNGNYGMLPVVAIAASALDQTSLRDTRFSEDHIRGTADMGTYKCINTSGQCHSEHKLNFLLPV